MTVAVRLQADVAVILAGICCDRARAALDSIPPGRNGQDEQVQRCLRVARAYSQAGLALTSNLDADLELEVAGLTRDEDRL